MALLRDDRGMTLIEVMIAITILVVGVLALMNTVTTGYLDVAFSGGESTATAAARQLFEQLKNQPVNPGPASGSDNPALGVTQSWTNTSDGATTTTQSSDRIDDIATW